MSSASSRRDAIKRLLSLGTLGLGGGLAATLGLTSQASFAGSADYRVVVCVYLSGGADGNDILIPTDGAYLDYAKARSSLAIAKDSLIALDGSSDGHTFALPPALKMLAPLYNQGRMAMIANVGALIKPVTAAQVLARTAAMPPFLMSHSEQTSYVQGWMGDADPSGWAGRSIELMPAALKKSLPVISYTNDYTLVLGTQSRVTQTQSSYGQYWGMADLSQPTNTWTRIVESMGNMQSRNVFEAEYARTMGSTFQDAITIAQVAGKSVEPAGTFPDNQLGKDLRHVASLLPVFKAQGIRRQVIMVSLGSFDTHVNQRGTSEFSLDSMLAMVGPALLAFDDAIKAAGLDQNVVTLTMTEFGRALQPASGGGTDHAWGNHWWLMGGPVQGRQVAGHFPSLALGGADDGDQWKKGRWVPTTSSDQVGASLMQWLGLPSDQLVTAFPSLVNFSQKTLPLLRS